MSTLSLNEIRNRCANFANDWKDEPGDERQQAQSFVRDLLLAFGITNPKAALYERRAQRASTHRVGYIDALLPGLAVIEMKSRGKDLVAAEEQAIDYIESLPEIEQPRWVITSDFARFRVLDLHALPDEDGEYPVAEFALTELRDNAEELAFLAGYQVRTFGNREQEAASITAAQLMGKLYEALEGSGYDEHEASLFLVRTLFALYADDSGVWERDLFYEFLRTRTSEDGSDLGPKLAQLYQALRRPPEQRLRNLDEAIARFPYVNGGIFEEPLSIPNFDREMRELLLEASSFNWAGISPAIFGSLFQAVKSPEARRALGEHYTTETNILKTINPLFMDELRERFTANAYNLRALKRLRSELSELRIMDPACGCGNFLVVAYRELRELDLQIMLRIRSLDNTWDQSKLFFSRDDLAVSLEQFYGIEIEEWPASIAQTALYLTDHQANQRMELELGRSLEPLPLQPLSTIHVGNALRTDWAEVLPPSPNVRIVGNPPFIGQYTKTAEQAEDLKLVWRKQYDGYLDYVTGWFKKSIEYFGTVPGRFAFVSTNSIAQGQPVPALFGSIFDAGWRVRFAHQTFAWTSEAPGQAAVHCVITGFDRNEPTASILYSYEEQRGEPKGREVVLINAYLLDAANVLVRKASQPLSPLLPEVRFGSKPADDGHLIVETEAIQSVRSDPIASKYLRDYRQGRELVRGLERWCLWMADADFDPADVARSAILRDRIEACRRWRSRQTPSGDAYKLRQTPHLFRPNPLRPLEAYVGIPRVVSAARLFYTADRLAPEVIAGDQLFTAVDPDGVLFGVVSSSMFVTWQRAVGGRMKSDLRFSNTLVWNTLPLPPVDEELRQAIIKAGQGVLDARALHPERSLATHYNPLAMAPELLKAHAVLDRVVDKAFGATRPLDSEEERLEILFARYAEMTA